MICPIWCSAVISHTHGRHTVDGDNDSAYRAYAPAWMCFLVGSGEGVSCFCFLGTAVLLHCAQLFSVVVDRYSIDVAGAKAVASWFMLLFA